MKAKLTFLLYFLLSSALLSQLLEENFDYVAGSNLTANGWTAHSSSGTNPITVNNGGLSYSGYASSGIGNAALLDNTGEDVHREFNTVSSGNIYYSFLINVINVSAGYFIHLSKTSSASFFAEVFIKTSGSGFVIGASNTSTAIYGTTVFNKLQTYLVIVKYEFSTQKVSVWVRSSGVPANEIDAGTPEVTMTGSGETSASYIALRQYSSSQNIIVDGIRVSTSWSTAPLPVELISFTATQFNDKIKLLWRTATEVNNYGFQVERQGESSKPIWEKIGFVPGAGNSNSPKDYSFIDANPLSGNNYYRLKQIDLNGDNEYSDIVEAAFTPEYKFKLFPNYPNPFNPETNITFYLARRERLNINLFNGLGQLIRVIAVDKIFEQGNHSLIVNASDLSSGTYLLEISGRNIHAVQKLLLIK